MFRSIGSFYFEFNRLKYDASTVLYFIALWNSDSINYRKNTTLLILLFIVNEVVHGNQVQLSFPLPAIDFYVVSCLIMNIIFFLKRKAEN